MAATVAMTVAVLILGELAAGHRWIRLWYGSRFFRRAATCGATLVTIGVE